MTKALVFPGQGSQSVGMGKDLFDAFSSAKDVFLEVDDALSMKLSEVIFNGPIEDLTLTQNAQPALMATSMAVVRVLEKDYNLSLPEQFSYVAGHSLGQYAALCASGALSLGDTARLLQKRGLAMSRAAEENPGKMAAIIGLSIEDVKEIAEKTGSFVANDNSIGQVVLSGSSENIERALPLAIEKGAKRALPLVVSGAFHSPLMKKAQEEMTEVLENAPIQTPKIALVDNVTAKAVTNPVEIKKLLIEQITGSVRWTESVQYMNQQGVNMLVEVGAGKVLSGLTKRIVAEMKAISINNILSLEEFVKTL